MSIKKVLNNALQKYNINRMVALYSLSQTKPKVDTKKNEMKIVTNIRCPYLGPIHKLKIHLLKTVNLKSDEYKN